MLSVSLLLSSQTGVCVRSQQRPGGHVGSLRSGRRESNWRRRNRGCVSKDDDNDLIFIGSQSWDPRGEIASSFSYVLSWWAHAVTEEERVIPTGRQSRVHDFTTSGLGIGVSSTWRVDVMAPAYRCLFGAAPSPRTSHTMASNQSFPDYRIRRASMDSEGT